MHVLRRTLLTTALLTTTAHAAPGYLQSPTLGGQTLAFTAQNTIWTVSQAGGTAQRLTQLPGGDADPILSPDGKQIVFSASYDGPTELYILPVTGGTPKRITFENSKARALGWDTHAGILYTAPPASGPYFSANVFALNPQTGARHVYPFSDANDAALSPDGHWIYFVRFGLAVTRDHLRAYRGGAMSQLWRFPLDNITTQEAERIGPQSANLRRPMPWRDRLIVISDKNGRDNLWSLAPDGSDPQQLTHTTEFSIREASLSGNIIAYRLGADLHEYDLTTHQDRLVPIDLVSDNATARPYWIEHPLAFLNDTAIAPNGDHAILTVRGHIVIASPGQQRLIELATPGTTRLRHAALSPDGKTLYAFSDKSGENQIWRFPIDGSSEGEMLTHNPNSEPTGLYISPDGKSIAHTDMLGHLSLLTLATKKDTLIDDASQNGTTDYASLTWAHDSKTLAFVRSRGSNLRNQIALYSLPTGKTIWATDGKYTSNAPSFSPDGHWLWFLSDRTFTLANDSPWGDRNLGPDFPHRTGLYALALQPGQHFPFEPKTELDDTSGKPPEKDKKDEKKSLPAIAYDGLPQRLYHVPIPGGDYQGLTANADTLFMLDGTDEDANPLKSLHITDTDPKLETYAPKVQSFDLSADGKTLMLVTPGAPHQPQILLVPAGAKQPTDVASKTVSLGKWRLRIDPAAEWQDMFNDAWRLHRDHFYDQALRGVDWNAVRARYAPLLPRLGSRDDLDDLLGQMVAELGALHSQLRPAMTETRPDADMVAGIGARTEATPEGFRIAHIYRGDPDLPETASPLLHPGTDAREGDIITAIDGSSTKNQPDLAAMLADQAGKQALLTLKRGSMTRRVVITPVTMKQDAALQRRDWAIGRAEYVDRTSHGRIGYLHLDAMMPSDMANFAREFYANIDKDGIVIDVRRNLGGNIDSWVLTQLLRRPWAFWSRYGVAPAVNMQQSYRGRLVVLCDELTYSDGETFSQGIKSLHIAPLIGERTAGAGVWLSDGDTLIDHGNARTAENPQFSMDGHWIVENMGVTPDQSIENMPVATFNGQDQQLDAALRNLTESLTDHPIQPLKAEPFPPPVPAPIN